MVQEAWKEWLNAYNHVKKGEKVYKNGMLLGVASGCYLRPTATSAGSVHLGKFKFISGQVCRTPKGWEMKNDEL